jgi:hypothetical protein
MNWFELSCKQASVLLSQAQERRLGLLERSQLQLHLIACNGCTNFLKQLHFIRTFIHHYRDGEIRD